MLQRSHIPYSSLSAGDSRKIGLTMSAPCGKDRNSMSSVWAIGNHVKVQGMSDDFKILSYDFILSGCVEMILESPEGGRIFLKRRKSQILNSADQCDTSQ